MKRRSFIEALPFAFTGPFSAPSRSLGAQHADSGYQPGRIPNEYSLFLAGERDALAAVPKITKIEAARAFLHGAEKPFAPGENVNGWQLLAVTSINGTDTAVFEKNVTYQGMIVYITQEEGVVLQIPKRIGSLARIRPRPINAPAVRFTRETPYVPGPDRLADYILHSNEDPCYENLAALGAEYIGYTLVANEESGPMRSLFLDAAGRSREISSQPEGQGLWAPDVAGAVFDPANFFPGEDPSIFRYVEGYSKRTLLGGYLPVADIGVWNPVHKAGYEVIVALPPGEESPPIGRVRLVLPSWLAERLTPTDHLLKSPDGTLFLDRYWNTSAGEFYDQLAGIANKWQHFFEDRMRVNIPDEWLLDGARAGIVLSRCSYRGLKPTYQIGEGAYTKIPERSHALFPVAAYEFVWAHQLWNLTREVEPYFQYYLDNYILPDGNFLYNTQDQVEAPLNAGVFLWNSARAYDYTRDVSRLQQRLPVLRRMIDFVLARYEYSKSQYLATDRRHGLIWGSPEADLGAPENDYPNSHPYYFQNATWTWRGLKEHAHSLQLAAEEHNLSQLAEESKRCAAIAAEMRGLIERSLTATIAAGTAEMRATGITPFTPDDVNRDPKDLSSYENHRFMMDWFTADWGVPELDLGHLKHRRLAGEQICGLHTDGDVARTSNFMEHGTLAVRIRQEDYRPFLLTLYALCCYAADSGNRYSPEDAYLPGSFPGDGSPYAWSAVVNSVLQPALGLRWLLCYEESDREVCHLQKAAPKHWFAADQVIEVSGCPTRFGPISWRTHAMSDREWQTSLTIPHGFRGDLVIHFHPPNGGLLASASIGSVEANAVSIKQSLLTKPLTISVRANQ